MKTLSAPFVKKIKKIMQDKDVEIETDLIASKDLNNAKYLYLHFKSRDCYVDVENDDTYVSTVLLLNKNKIKYHIALEGEDKCLLWVPYDQQIKYLIEQFDGPTLCEVKEHN